MDIERTMQFILEQQAQFASDIQILKDTARSTQEAIRAHHEQFSNEMTELRNVVLDLATSHQRTNEIVAVLAERQVQTEEALRELAASSETIKEMIAASNQRTDELIAASNQRTDELIAASSQRTDERIAASNQRTDELIAASDQKAHELIAALAEQQMKTEEGLQDLLRVVERHIANH